MPWSKLPRHLRGDWRITQRTPLALAAFLLAWLAADDAGSIAPAGARSARDALAAQVATLPGVTLVEACEAVEECVVAELLVEVGAALHLADWVHDGTPAASRPAVRADAAPRRPGRPAKGDAPMSSTERSWRLRFGERSGMFRDAAPGSTFEEWLAAHPEAATKLAELRNGSLQRNPADATKPRNETPQRNPGDPRAVSDTLSPSGASEEQRRAEEDDTSDAQRNVAAAATKRRNETPDAPGPGFVAPPSGLRLSTVETLSPVEPDVLFNRLDAVVRVDGDLRIQVRGGAATEAALLDFVRSLVARQVHTLDEVVAAFAFGAREGWVAKSRRSVGLPRVLKDDGALLMEWLHHSRRAPGARDAAGDESSSADDLALARAKHRYRTEALGPGETKP